MEARIQQPLTDQDVLRLLRYARRAMQAAADALDEVRPALAGSGYELRAATDFSAWECHVLWHRCCAIYAMAEHRVTGRPLPSYEPLSGWLT